MFIRPHSAEARLRALALLFFVGLAFLTLHPILFSTGVKTAGYDFFNYNWNFWWIRHALTTPGLNVYENNFAMFPFTTNYGYHALTAVWFPVWALLEPLIGTLAVMNVIITLVCVLNGWLFFVLLRREKVAPGLALIAGAALQISPIVRYFYYNTHINLMDWFWLPAELLLWQRIMRAVAARYFGRAIGWAALQGITLWGILLTDLQFPIFTAFLLVPYVIFTVVRAPKRDLAKIISVGLIVPIVALPLAWFLGPLPYILHFSGTLAPGTVEDRPGVPFPSGLLSMSQTWWEWSTPSLGAFVTVVLIVTLIGVFLWRRKRNIPVNRWLWFALLLPPLLLMLGPNITIAGATIAMPPFRLLYAQTNGMFKMPWRLAPIFIIAALLFVGKSWTPIFKRMSAGRIFLLGCIFLLLTIDVRLFESAPLQPAPIDYSFYHQMGSENYDYTVLEVPTGAATGDVILGDPRATQLQWYGMTHEKHMVNGFISRAPLENYWYMLTDDPLLSWLGQRRFLEPDKVEPELRDHIFKWPIGYVVIHTDLIGLDSSTNEEIIGYFNSLDDLLCPYTVEGAAVVYRTRWHPDGCAPRTPPQTAPGVYTIDIGSPGDEAYIGWGWHYQEQVSGLTLRWSGVYPQTQVYVDLPPNAYTVTLSAQAFHEARQLRLLVNDVPLGEPVSVSVDALHEYSFTLPAAIVDDGKHLTLTLDYDAAVAPADVEQGGDTRKLAVAVDWIRFTATNS